MNEPPLNGSVLVFRRGARFFAVPAAAVIDVVGGTPITRLPGVSPAGAGLGLAALRGSPAVVIEPGVAPEGLDSDPDLLLFVRAATGAIAIPADELVGSGTMTGDDTELLDPSRMADRARAAIAGNSLGGARS